MTSPFEFLAADWDAPSGIRVGHTTRLGGVSTGRYRWANLATHVGDDAQCVEENRRRLERAVGVDGMQWLDQVHGVDVVEATRTTTASVPTADACWTKYPDLPIAMMTADCIPLVIAHRSSALVGVAHCGWRGTVAGVISNLIEAVDCAPQDLRAWLGPGICGRCYEVGTEVVAALDTDFASDVTAARGEGHWLFDLPGYVAAILRRAGVASVAQSGLCTHHDERFYSYRRDGATGRIATLAWIAG